MQRGISGKTRRGAPPLPRQRKALRIVQVTLAAMAVFMAMLTISAWTQYRDRPSSVAQQLDGRRPRTLAEVLILGSGAVFFAGGCLAMGARTVRGPEPPRPPGF